MKVKRDPAARERYYILVEGIKGIEKIAVDLGEVQKTLFLPLWGRAVESLKAHPMLVDKTAQAIMQAVDIDFVGIAKNVSEMSQVAFNRIGFPHFVKP